MKGGEEDSDEKPEEGPERTWTQQRTAPENPVSVCSSEYHPATIPGIHFKFSPQSK